MQTHAKGISLFRNSQLCFPIVIDKFKSADVSNIEHTVTEEFLPFVSTTSITGEELHALLTTEIRKHGLNPDYIMGQGYDGAGNMAEKCQGHSSYPNAKCVHCRNHCLNLAIVMPVDWLIDCCFTARQHKKAISRRCHACKIAFVQSLFTVVGDILFFLTNSPKRQAAYSAHTNNAEIFIKLCPTRWSLHSESVSAFLRNFEATAETLVDLQSNHDTKTMSSGSSLHKAIQSFDFIIALCVVGKPLDTLNPLSNSMQDPTCDLVKASEHAMALHVVCFKNRRKKDDVQYYDEIWDAAITLANQQNVAVDRLRTAGRQQHRNNVPAPTVKDYWRLSLFLPFMDHLRTELENRLWIPHPPLKAQYLTSNKIIHLIPVMWEDIKIESAPFADVYAIKEELDI